MCERDQINPQMTEKDKEVNKQNAFSFKNRFFLILETLSIEQAQLVTDIKTYSLSLFTRTKKRHFVLTILLCVLLSNSLRELFTRAKKKKKKRIVSISLPFPASC